MSKTEKRFRLHRVSRWVRNPWLKAIAAIVVLVVLFIWLRDQLPFFERGFDAIRQPEWSWVALCLAASFLSMSSFASVQRTLLVSANVPVTYRSSLGLILAANAFSVTIPGGQVFSTALTYQQTRRWGASRVVASWQLVVSGVLAGVGLALLALFGFFLVGTVSNPVLLLLSALGLAGFIVVIQWAARNPHRIESIGLSVLRWLANKRKVPVGKGAKRLSEIVQQAEAVELSRRNAVTAFSWSLTNWVADVVCLGAAAYAVGAHPSIGGLAIAYVTGKIVGSAPVTPGGIGTVEFALITALTAGGMTIDRAFAAVFVYRICSFVLVAIIGWLVFFIVYRGTDIADSAVEEAVTEGSMAKRAGASGQGLAATQEGQRSEDNPSAERPK